MNDKQLISLKKEYNIAIVRYNKMLSWIETASEEDQLKNYRHVFDVINTCNRLLNEIREQQLVTPGEILNGFKGV